MEILYPILAFIFGAVLAYFIIKYLLPISRKIYDELNQNFTKKADLRNTIKSTDFRILKTRKRSHPFSNRNYKPTQNRIGKKLLLKAMLKNSKNLQRQNELNQKQNNEIKIYKTKKTILSL